MQRLQAWAHELGFSQIGIAGIDLTTAEPGLLAWLAAGFHGDMGYMAAHGLKRARPAELVPGTASVISVRMDYLPRALPAGWQALQWQGLQDPARAQLSIYARGRDYHKVLRPRLQRLADRLQAELGPIGHRAFTDSAPVLEVELATRAAASAGAASTRWRCTATAARCSSWVSSSSMSSCRPPPRWTPIAASAAPASTSAPRRPSWRPTGWMRGAASPT